MPPATVTCHQNVALAAFLSTKRDELRQPGSGHDSGNLDAVIHQAYKSVCLHKDPILSLQHARKVRGIGNWILNILKSEFFQEKDDPLPPVDDIPASRAKAPRRYLPQKNSAPYAILITLYRSTVQGEKEFLFKQELIEAADSSGLSSKPIEPGRGSGATGRFGDSSKDWYSGWSSMKTLISRGLVVKSNCPARYKLTSEGSKIAAECLGRSGLDIGQDLQQQPHSAEAVITQATRGETRVRGGSTRRVKSAVGIRAPHSSDKDVEFTSLGSSSQSRLPDESMYAQLKGMGFKDEDVKEALIKAKTSTISESGSLYEVALQHLLEDMAACTDGQDNQPGTLTAPSAVIKPVHGHVPATLTARCSSGLPRPPVPPSSLAGAPAAIDQANSNSNRLDTPPLKNGESFRDVYDVILILDAREHYARVGTNCARKFAERLMRMYNVVVAVRHLPVGDATWVARHKLSQAEYMLDFIVERKRVDDLWTSIKDKRYKDQKLRLRRCGINRLIYLIEGDPNLTDATETIKTAAFTTELADGFDVQRTIDIHETMKRYGELTEAIAARYALECNTSGLDRGECLTFSGFLDHCKDLEKERVSDVYAIQLTQVRLVTEDVALSVLDKYPTLAALAQGYLALEGNQSAQEDMLKGLPIRNKNRTISSAISKSVYNFIWAPSSA